MPLVYRTAVNDGVNCVCSAHHKNLGRSFSKEENVRWMLISPVVSLGVSGKQQSLILAVFNIKGTYWDDSGAGGPSLEKKPRSTEA